MLLEVGTCYYGNEIGTDDNVVTLYFNTADLNGDNLVNGLDVSEFLTRYEQGDLMFADLNRDERLNGTDIGLFLSSYHESVFGEYFLLVHPNFSHISSAGFSLGTPQLFPHFECGKSKVASKSPREFRSDKI